MNSKNWRYTGEVSKEDRPINSLLDTNILFDQNRPNVPISKDSEAELKKIILRRLKEKQFDNFIPKKKEDTVFEDNEKVESESQYEEDMTKEEMVELFWEIDAELNKICNFGNNCVIGVEKINEKKIFEEKKIDRKKENRKKKTEKLLKEMKKNKNVKIY